MKQLLPVSLLFLLFLPVSTSLMAQNKSQTNFTLSDNRELPFVLTPDEKWENSLSYSFAFEAHWKGSQVIARFSGMPGAYSLLINQFNFGKVKDGESAVEFNITPFLTRGENTLRLAFDSTTTSLPGRFAISGLCFREAVHISNVKISSFPLPRQPGSLVRVHLYLKSYQDGGKLNRTISLTIADSCGQHLFNAKKVLDFPLAYGQETEINFDCSIEDPSRWGPQHPYLYGVQVHLLKEGKLHGEILQSNFGIRKAEFADSLFIIDGDTLPPVFAESGKLQTFADMNDDEILAFFESNGYNAIRADTLLPARIMMLFDRHGILVLRKSILMEDPSFLQDYNRPSVIPVN